MPSWTAPRTWVAGNVLSAAELNTDVRDNAGYLKAALDDRVAIRQVLVASYSTEVTTTSGTYVDTGLSQAITIAASSSVLIVLAQNGACAYATDHGTAQFRLARGATQLSEFIAINSNQINGQGVTTELIYLDTPGSAGPHTYKTQFRRTTANGTAGAQAGNYPSTLLLVEIGA